jgi:hypothetical protein
MRDITRLSTRAEIKRVWVANNNVMIEPRSTLEATQQVVKILDAKYDNTDLNAVVNDNCNKLLKLLTAFEDHFDGMLGDWDTEPVSLS